MHDKTAASALHIAAIEWRGAGWQLCLPYLQALAIYLSSRLLVFLGIALGQIYVPAGHDIPPGSGRWYHHLLRWDSEWYGIIAATGYSYNGEPGVTQTVVFYPLYPVLSRVVSEALGIDVANAMLLVANLAAVAAILLLFKLVRECFDERSALATVALVAFFPASIFLSAGYTESLALLLMVAFFLSFARERFLLAAVFAGLATATRASGIVLLPVLLWELWRYRSPRRFAIEAFPLSIVATAGLILYIAYLAAAFGHPMAFADGQAAFHENTTLASRLLSALTLEPFRKIDLADVSPAGLDRWLTLVVVALLVRAWFTSIGSGMILFSILLLALPYFTLCGGPAGFTSMARFNLVSFPLFIVIARSTEGWPWAVPAVTGVFGGLLMMYSALFAQWQWVG
jgi:4-amino-4-deoxy-L-arabinose transferase-like glycosyltransferase